MSEWQPIETAPKHGPCDKRVILAWCGNDDVVIGWFEDNKFTDGHGYWYLATHWMPLPEPPKQ